MSKQIVDAGNELVRALGGLDEADPTSERETVDAADHVTRTAKAFLPLVSQRRSQDEVGRVLALNAAIRGADRNLFSELGFLTGDYAKRKSEALGVMRRMARDCINREQAL